MKSLLPVSMNAIATWLVLANLSSLIAQGTSLRFFGNGVNDIDRVKIRIDDPSNSLPGPPADVGAEDFTIEFWLRGRLADNAASAVACGFNNNWINGNIVLDRDRFNQERAWGLSLGNGRVAWGIIGEFGDSRTICSTTNVLDDEWHHVVMQRRRSDGRMWIFIDGNNEAETDGPDGDVSYPDNGVPGNFCGGPCVNSDPFIVLAAEKHDAGPSYPSFSGWLDEVRISNSLRYSSDFNPPTQAFATDAETVALYHFDEGTGTDVFDTSGAAGGPSNGVLQFGGNPAGPLWSTETPFSGGLLLTQDPLQRGQTADLIVTNAQSGETVTYLYSVAGSGSGPCPPALGGLCLNLLPPITVAGSSTANGVGTATLTVAVPATAPLLTVYTQAVVQRGPGGADSAKTNFVAAPVLP